MAGKTIDSSQYNCLGRDGKQIDPSLPKQLTQHVIFKKSKLGICQTKWILLWTGGIQGWALLAELWVFYCLVHQISRGYECFLCGDVRHNNTYIRRCGTSTVITTRVLGTLISMHRSVFINLSEISCSVLRKRRNIDRQRFRNIQIEQIWHLKCIFPLQATSINPWLYGFKYFSVWALTWFFCVCHISRVNVFLWIYF